MLLFFQVLFTMFIAELGDKTQLLMVAMTSRFKLRDIILGSAAAILVLNALAVGVGAVISQFIPGSVIKIIAALAFFYFAWSTLKGDDEDEEARDGKANVPPILTVFGTFFLAELGDKTQLTAIAFAANEGLEHAIAIWLACSIGLFAADLLGMLLGHLLKSKLPEGFLDKLAFVIFAVFGFTTMAEGVGLLGVQSPFHWVIAAGVAAVFALLCVWTVRRNGSTKQQDVPKSDR
ncbi:MAG: TMEM165/GDT1 family protein [Oscillospiraceae bacterium]|nr:TMEM165/GDT1 family protein [Oscillospiraceae bacterium]